MTSARMTARAMLAGCAAAAAILVGAPMAGAEPPPEECQQQDAPPANGEQQQCEDQGPGMPNLPDPPQNQNQDQDDKGNRLSDTNCWMYPEGPEWFPPGTAPRPVMAGTQVWPCYYVLGLQPTLPGS